MSVSTYPVRVDAHLDPGLNRWLWLVKWVLVIPHYVVLAFLSVGAVLAVIALWAFRIALGGQNPFGSASLLDD